MKELLLDQQPTNGRLGDRVVKANYIVSPNWETTRKLQSRLDTIIGPFRSAFGHAIPSDTQYWSMCGAHYHLADDFADEPTVIDGELMQLVKSGIITKDQFIGVDRNRSVIANNNKVYPDVKWIHDDFKIAMSKAASAGNFHPAIINYDGVRGPRSGAPYLKSIMQMVDYNVNGDVMLVGNFVLRNPYCLTKQWEGAEVVQSLLRTYTPPDHWHLMPYCYTYKGGSGSRSHTLMGSFVLVKKGHSLVRTPNRRLDDLEIK